MGIFLCSDFERTGCDLVQFLSHHLVHLFLKVSASGNSLAAVTGRFVVVEYAGAGQNCVAPHVATLRKRAKWTACATGLRKTG